MIRALVDINVIISAVIIARGFPFAIWSAWQAGHFTLLTAEGVLVELQEKLQLPKISQRYGIDTREATAILALLRSQAELVLVPTAERVIVTQDPEDDLILAAARIAQADYLVTGDRRLLELEQYAGVSIVSPRKFAQILGLPRATQDRM